MARRRLLTGEERRRLFDIPDDETAIVGHYTLAAEDLELVGRRYRPPNRLGLATQIALMRSFTISPPSSSSMLMRSPTMASARKHVTIMPTLRHGIWGYTFSGEGIYRSRSISPQELRSGPIGANLLSAH